ncbi:MAG: hypothetical protein JW953_09000 [Anaerolineae bacterium]|nr:hypothetical protein [Anaerolineae bacterium]
MQKVNAQEIMANFWGTFYAALHSEAEKIRQMQTAPGDSLAAHPDAVHTESTEIDRHNDFTSPPVLGQTGRSDG